MKLAILSGGLIDAVRGVIHPGDDSHRRVRLPCMQVYIEGDNGERLLVDTGMPPEVAGNRAGLEQELGIKPGLMLPVVEPDERVDRQLANLGVAMDQLDYVINTHVHFDHAGGNRLCRGRTISVQGAEIEAARDTPEYLSGEEVWWDAPGVQFALVEGDWSPIPGVEMLFTPGHSPGHQSMLVRLRQQPWLFTWDAVYTEEHWRTDKLGVVRDVTQARASMERLRAIAAHENARLIFGHDIAQWSALRRAPHFYT